MIAFNHVVPVLNLSVFNVRRAPAFAFEQSKRATIGGRFIRVDESRDLPLLHVVEDFTQKPVCSFAVTTGGEIKIDSAAPAVDGPVQIRPAAIDLHVGFIHVPRAKIGRVTPVPAQPFFHFRRITLNPAVNRGVIDIHSAFSQHLLQLTVTDAVFAVPAYGPQNDVTLKMPAFEWVHVQLHQQKGMISLSPPTICNSARAGIPSLSSLCAPHVALSEARSRAGRRTIGSSSFVDRRDERCCIARKAFPAAQLQMEPSFTSSGKRRYPSLGSGGTLSPPGCFSFRRCLARSFAPLW
nr:hypothetical protein CPHELBEB_03477 [Salmonella sp.]